MMIYTQVLMERLCVLQMDGNRSILTIYILALGTLIESS